MRKPMARTVAGIVLVVGVLDLVKFMQIRAAIKAGSSWQPPPETVTTLVASAQDWSATIEAVGSVAPARGVTLAADLPGVAQSISFQSRSAFEVTERDPMQPVSEDEIRIRAYEVFLERGAEPGDELSDWPQAERERRRSRP